MRVLVVDDESDVCWALERLLLREGYTVETVRSSAEALSRLSASVFDLVLVDAKLPDIDGIDLARRIRAETPCELPLVLVSGYFYSDDGLIQECLSSGLFSAFVTKPFQHEGLVKAIRKALSAKAHTAPTVRPS